jgi:hypothetical protein
MLFATLLALGPEGVLWPLMAHVPPFTEFRWPVKLLPFIAFFACVGGGLQLERWSSHWRPGRAQWLAGATMGLVLLNAGWAQACWYNFGDRPYPALNPSYAALIDSSNPATAGRLLTRPEWFVRSPVVGFFRTQALNFPTITKSLSFGGYDTFVESSPQNKLVLKRFYKDPVSTARAYGVRWLIWDNHFTKPVFSPNPLVMDLEMPPERELSALSAVRSQSEPALAVDGVQLYRMNDTDPLAFIEGSEKKPLSVRFDMRGATVETAGISPGLPVVVNVLWRPWMKAFADGRSLQCHADAWGRVALALTGPAGIVEVFYCPPWIASGLKGAGIAVLGGLFGWFLRYRARRGPVPVIA